MSVEAISWVLNEAPGVPPQLVATLIGLANHASPDGRGAYPSQKKLCEYTRKKPRTIRTDLVELEQLGLIRRGDQRLTDHLPADRRPVVYDLAIEGPSTSRTGGPSKAAGPSTAARSSKTPRPSTAVAGGRTRPRRGAVHGRQTVLEPTTEPKNTPPPSADPPEGAKTDRGTRLPDDFPVTPEMGDWARANTPQCGLVDHEAFCDYWRSVPGAKGRKLDWVATWRNWMRREQQQRASRASPRPTARRSGPDDRLAAIQALKRNQPDRQPLNLIRGELA